MGLAAQVPLADWTVELVGWVQTEEGSVGEVAAGWTAAAMVAATAAVGISVELGVAERVAGAACSRSRRLAWPLG